MNIKYSIIIPVLNEVEKLNLCLNALKNQIQNKADAEIIVVDNGSTDGSEKLADKYGFTSLKYEDLQSPYIARNEGAKMATSNNLVFLDSKCIPNDGYISEIERITKIDNWDLIGGDFEFLGLTSISSLSELAYAVIYLRTNPKLNNGEVSALTGNMMVKRDVFQELGGFDEKRSGGDVRFSKLAAQNGKRKVFEPNLLVGYHPKKKGDLVQSTIRDAKDSPHNISIFSVRPAGDHYVNERLKSLGVKIGWIKSIKLRFYIMYLRGLKYYHQAR